MTKIEQRIQDLEAELSEARAAREKEIIMSVKSKTFQDALSRSNPKNCESCIFNGTSMSTPTCVTCDKDFSNYESVLKHPLKLAREAVLAMDSSSEGGATSAYYVAQNALWAVLGLS